MAFHISRPHIRFSYMSHGMGKSSSLEVRIAFSPGGYDGGRCVPPCRLRPGAPLSWAPGFPPNASIPARPECQSGKNPSLHRAVLGRTARRTDLASLSLTRTFLPLERLVRPRAVSSFNRLQTILRQRHGGCRLPSSDILSE
ncbi:hypothetical protein ARMSODRAFT_734707 [Armillaria solidipes]|uniref:Uncharacterized protein n=1 Tax=Armillaria solidipes TaxID=1076256 RepID=A0A2H3B6C8_9AGAR|nr:hypothetical protein ARMSODRAFT_734707 [Armillaria solidipes]